MSLGRVTALPEFISLARCDSGKTLEPSLIRQNLMRQIAAGK